MTGVTLPRCARLQSTDDTDNTGKGEIPDAEWAAGWLAEHRNDLPDAEQILFGRPMDRRSLATACRRCAGTASADLVRQARLVIGPHPAPQPDQRLRRRCERLDAAGCHDEVIVPPEAATADPWEYGHYA